MKENEALKTILYSDKEKLTLSQEQCQILLDENKNTIILASAGSGKTMTMVAKIIYLIKYKKINPNELLILAFTNEAVYELKKRLSNYGYFCGKVFTFHKLALEIINFCGKSTNNVVEGMEEFVNSVENLIHKDPKFKNKLKKFKKGKQKTKFLKEFYQLFRYFKTSAILYHDIKNIDLRYCIKAVNEEYQNLMNKKGTCDFDDLIITATLLLKEEGRLFPIKYILIDELQDLSKIRYYLVQMIQIITSANMIGVGDDFQSIYGFSGSELTIFYHLLKESKVYYLSNTYRNSQELIDIAGKFITRGKNHIEKKLYSNKSLKDPIQYYYYINCFKRWCFLNILKNLTGMENEVQTIFILGRFSHDGNFLKEMKELKKISENQYQYQKITLKFFTIHRVKGLTADEVIIVNMNCGEYGFPAMKDNFYLNEILPNYQKRHDLEERRLFYVALTRTKNHVYIMIPLIKRSKFISELKEKRFYR